MSVAKNLAPYLLAGLGTLGACGTWTKKPTSTLTVIYGAEYPRDTAAFSTGVAHNRDIINENRADIPGLIIGDGKTTLSADDIGAGIRTMKRHRVKSHNVIVDFHANAVMDSTETYTFYRENSLKNHLSDAKDPGLMGGDILSTIGDNMMTTFKRYDHIRMAYYPCQGASVLPLTGEMPAGSHIWIASDADAESVDYHLCLVHSFSREKPWNMIGQDYFIESALLLQNSTVTMSDVNFWQRGGAVAVVTKAHQKNPDMKIDDKTLRLGRRQVMVIDLEENAATLSRDFTIDQLKEEGKQLRPLIPLMQRAAVDERMSKREWRDYVPDDAILRLHKMDENIIDITIDKLQHVKTLRDYTRTLTDPEQRMAQVLAYRLYSRDENIKLVTPLADYIRTHNIMERIPVKIEPVRHPRYESTSSQLHPK